MITRPSAAALGAMETGIAANRGGCFKPIPISEKKRNIKKKKRGFCGMICLKGFAPIFWQCQWLSPGHDRGTERGTGLTGVCKRQKSGSTLS